MAKQKISKKARDRKNAVRRKPNVPVTGREVLEGYIGRFGISRQSKIVRRDSDITLNFKRHLFPQQLDFINDPSKRKAALCTRRAGKSFAVSRYLIQEALQTPGTLCVYIARTREAAKRILWNMLKQADKQYRLGLKFNNASLIAKFPNDSEIIFTGANDASDVDKLRGAAFSLAVLDEAAFFNIDLKELVREVLSPALLDTDGTLAMIGTPSRQCAGMFHDITEKDLFEYSVHRWTIKDNPHMALAVKSIERDIRSGVLDPSDPAYKREYEGIWVQDDRSMVYQHGERNLYHQLPENCFWEYVMGIDLGYHDATAFVITAFSEDAEELYIVDEFKKKNMLTSDVEEVIRQFQAKYNFSKIVMDTGGGSSRMVMETFKTRTGLPITPAKKTGDKVGIIKLMNADLARGLIKVKHDAELLEEWAKLQYNLAGTAEDKRFDNHLSDAALYAWMESRHYLYEVTPDKAAFGSPEYYKELEDRMEQRLLDEQESMDGADSETWGTGYATEDVFFN
jgi:PBSX family phage terminase large subunit